MLKRIIVVFAYILGIHLVTIPALAEIEGKSAKSSVSVKSMQEASKLKYGLDLVSYYYTNLKKSDVRRNDMDFWVVPNYQITDDFKLTYYAVFAKDFENDKKFQVALSQIRVTHKTYDLNQYVKSMLGVRYTVPNNTSSFNKSSLRGAVLLENTFSLNTAALDMAKVSISYQPRITSYVHQYTTQATGTLNSKWQFQNRIDVGYNLSDKWSLSGLFIHNVNRSYNGVRKASFYLGEAVAYKATDKLILAAGHSNEADVLASNGADSNLNVFDKKTSYIYGNASYKF